MNRRIAFSCIVVLAPVLLADWEPDLRLTNDGSVSQTSPNSGWCVAAANDTVHVVWFDYRDGGDKIFYRRSTDAGSSWAPETTIVDTPAYYPGSPVVSLAVSDAGGVHVAWCDYLRGSDDEIFYKRSPDGGATWRPDTMLTRDDFMVEADSWASIAASGPFIHAAWHDYKWDGVRYNWDIFHKRSGDNGAHWEPEQRLTNDPGSSGPPAIAALDSLVHVAWYDTRDGNPEIYWMRSTDHGQTWGPDTRLTSNAAYSYMPTIGACGRSVHVSWFDDRDGDWEIYYKRSTDAGATWGDDTRLTDSPGESYRSSIAVAGLNIHLVWYDRRDGNQEIYYKRSTDNGATWGPDTALTSDPAASFYPSVAVWGDKVHVVWTDERDGNREIYYKRNPTGNAGTEERVIKVARPAARTNAAPNPFSGFTVVPGYEQEYFDIYDAAGKRVTAERGGRLGLGLPAGIYFLKSRESRQRLTVIKIK